jgi:hypothetical protein
LNDFFSFFIIGEDDLFSPSLAKEEGRKKGTRNKGEKRDRLLFYMLCRGLIYQAHRLKKGITAGGKNYSTV